MKTDPLQAAADATAGYLLELVRKGTSIVSWANLHDFFLSRGIKEREHAVAMVLASRGYLSPRPWVPRRDSLGRELPILNIFRNSEPSSWTILPAIFGTVATDPPAPGEDAAQVIEKVMLAVDPLNRDVIRIVGDDTKGPKAKGIELLNLDSRFHDMTAAEFARLIGARNIGRWFNTERAKAVKQWRQRADRLD